MSLSKIGVRKFTHQEDPSHFTKITESLALTFQDDYNYSRFVPNDEERARRLIPIKKIILTLGKRYGFIDVTSDLRGVSVWFDSQTGKRTNWRILRSGFLGQLPKAGLKFTYRMLKYYDSLSHVLEKKYASFHHVYLSFIGVHPEFQKNGYGSNLLKPMLAYADRHKLPCYLECPKTGLIPFYSKFGFQLIESAHLEHPFDDCVLHVMVRNIS
ncbi:MAG: GNAT family N-acetyltransferase [Promethearchaeota archaeon]